MFIWKKVKKADIVHFFSNPIDTMPEKGRTWCRLPLLRHSAPQYPTPLLPITGKRQARVHVLTVYWQTCIGSLFGGWVFVLVTKLYDVGFLPFLHLNLQCRLYIYCLLSMSLQAFRFLLFFAQQPEDKGPHALALDFSHRPGVNFNPLRCAPLV